MGENRWWGALGVQPPEDTGAKGQEVAEPATNTEGTGAKAQEVTDPAESVTEPLEGAASSEGGQPEGEVSPAEQSPEERRKQAEVRRQRERQEADEKIRKEEAEKFAQQMKAAFASLGLKDDEGNVIETMEAFEAMQAAQRAARIRSDLRAGKLTEEALRAAVLEDPAVKSVLEKAQNAATEAEAAKQKANSAVFAANMQQEMEAIRKIDPSIKSTDDIIRKETGPEYARYVRMGLKPSEAFRLANYDAIRDRDRNAAEQAARNAAAGKSHLQGTQTSGGQALAVPEEYKRNMRRFVPGITEEEIAKQFRKHQNK